MDIQAIIFDFGGVLVHNKDNSRRALWEARLGLPPNKLSEWVFFSDVAAEATVGKVPVSAIWRYVADALALDEDTLRQLQHDFWWGDRLDEELAAFLGALRGPYKTAILSNAWSDARVVFTERFHLERIADVMVISAEVGLAKPDPRIYRLALAELGAPAESAIFVDDVAENVAAARALGLHAIQYQSAAQVVAEIRRVLDENPGR